jgi:hypothetical protein
MKKASVCFKKIHVYFWLILTLIVMCSHTLCPASGAIYDFMEMRSNATCILPSVILQDGADNVSFVYTNNTSAKITINATEESQTYNYTLNILNNSSNNYEVKLEVSGNPNVTRISNAVIGFYDNSTFYDQIIIGNGTIVQPSGTYINLTNSSLLHIKIENLQESENGDTYFYVYIWIKENNSSIYTLYVIIFEFT